MEAAVLKEIDDFLNVRIFGTRVREAILDIGLINSDVLHDPVLGLLFIYGSQMVKP